MKGRGRLLFTIPAAPRRVAPGAMSSQVGRLIAAARAGDLGWLPPIVEWVEEGVFRELSVARRARHRRDLEAVLQRPRFRPFLAFVEALGTWADAQARVHARLVARSVLRIESTALFGGLVADAFCRAAAGKAAVLPAVRTQFEEFLELFFRRLTRDSRDGVMRRAGARGKLVAIGCRPDETHNGGQSVLALEFANGVKLAYKPRPASGEWLLVREGRGRAPGSLFEWLNRSEPTSGRIQLPTMRILRGRGRDRRDYGWHEWIERPKQWGIVRRSRRLSLEGCRLPPAEAAGFWHRAGSLAAACFAVGVQDLVSGNLVAGVRRGQTRPLLYAIDLEVFSVPLDSLVETGLVDDGRARHPLATHHVGLERVACWGAVGGPMAGLVETADGVLELRAVQGSFARETAPGLVSDTRGRIGPGPYLGAFLRGMFDAWTALMVNARRVARFLGRNARGELARVLQRSTGVYWDELRRMAFGSASTNASAGFDEAERAQLLRLDVPYFTATPDRDVLAGSLLHWESFGRMVRDTVAYVGGDRPVGMEDDARWGVTVQGREVAFDWREAGQRLRFSWTDRALRMNPEPLAPLLPKLEPSIRRQLLALDRVDADLRRRWVDGGHVDRAVERDLERLGRASSRWLREVIDEHGWPGRRLVGEAASAAACRLVQHADLPVGLAERCLRLMNEAAEREDIPWRDVAYATDALRLGMGQKQLFGTKLTRAGDGFVPLPLSRPNTVDRRRQEAGLEPLASYLTRAKLVFAENAGEVT